MDRMSNEEFERAFDEAFESETQAINDQLSQEVLLALVGDVNCGKSSTINRLMDEEVSIVGAKPGETVQIQEIKYKENIIFVDTPGLDDVHKENSDVTLEYYKKADIILFFLNAAGTVLSEGELKNLKDISKTNEDIIIVLNKIDAAEDVPSLIKYIEDKTLNQYIIAPVSSKTGENFEYLQRHILSMLNKKSKDILLGKNLKDKSSVANRWILGASASAAGIGLSPIPGSDIVPIVGIQVGMMLKLANLYDKPLSKGNAKELIIATVVGNVGRAVFRQLVKVIPGAGSAVGASVAGATTLALGHAIKYMHENGIEIDVEQLQYIYNMFLARKM